MTLALPHSAKSGDVLELVVTGRREQTITARTLDSGAAVELENGTPQASLSQTGRLISQLLTGRYGETRAIPLSKGKALQSKSSIGSEKLASSLKQAISQSGLFYESHLKSWAEGKTVLAELMQEPQAANLRFSAAQPNTFSTAQGRELSTGSLISPFLAENGEEESRPSLLLELETEFEELEETKKLRQQSVASNEEAAAGKETTKPGQESLRNTLSQRYTLSQENIRSQSEIGTYVRQNNSQPMPEALMPLVYQQLETLATNQVQWQFQPWPGMNVEWNLVNPDQERASGSDDEMQNIWRSQLRLHMPLLGEVDVLLVFSDQGLNIRLDTDNDLTAGRMRIASQKLVDSLVAAGVTVNGLSVSEHASA